MDDPARASSRVKLRDGEEVEIGPIEPFEIGALFDIFDDVVESGDGYPHAPPLTSEVFNDTWVRVVSTVIAARHRGELVGAYYLKPNSVGRAAHIANAGYLVTRAYRRRGIGRALVEDSISRASFLGFDAIQFNLVFASNPARRLYEELGWQLVGTIPKAIEGGDALIYWRPVAPPAK